MNPLQSPVAFLLLLGILLGTAALLSRRAFLVRLGLVVLVVNLLLAALWLWLLVL